MTENESRLIATMKKIVDRNQKRRQTETYIDRLKTVLKVDPNALHALLETRVPCAQAITAADCPAVPYHDPGSDQLQLGALGLLNGLLAPDGFWVVAVFDQQTGQLVDFKLGEDKTDGDAAVQGNDGPELREAAPQAAD